MVTSSKNIALDRKQRHILSICLSGQDSCCTCDWKRLARNIDLNDEDLKRLQTRYTDIDNMICNIDYNNEILQDKCFKMLEELERCKGGELWWSEVNKAFEKIGRTGCANKFLDHMLGKCLIVYFM